jgi:hypothetical protein
MLKIRNYPVLPGHNVVVVVHSLFPPLQHTVIICRFQSYSCSVCVNRMLAKATGAWKEIQQ